VPLLTFIILVLVAAVAPAAETHPHIVTSFLPLYSWATTLVGEHASVENLLPVGSEPHDYAFTFSDARKLERADLVVVNGLGLEAWLPKFLANSAKAKDRVVTISQGMESNLIEGEHEHGAHEHQRHANPHVWLDPQLAAHGVSNILVALQRADPAHASAYATNAQRYLARLDQLDRDIQEALAGVTNRAIVTYHDAFPYFARRYGLKVAGVVEEVPEVNPTAKYLSRLGRVMRGGDIRVIFIPPGGRTKVAQRIAADLRAELIELDTLESGPLTPSAYEERMRNNAAVLQKHLK